MKQKTTKLMTLALMLIMSFNVNAYDFEVDGLYYTIISTSNLTCKVDKGDVAYSGDIVVPSEVQYRGKTLRVTEIGDVFKGSEISSIICPAESLSESSFRGCARLEKIELNGQLSVLPSYCFYDCKLLKEYNFPSTIIQIDDHCFYNCISLENMPCGIQVLGEGAFENCSSLEEIDLSEISSEIPRYAFRECTKLRSVQLSQTLKTIGEEAFYNCKNLSSVEFPEGLEKISDKSFFGCENIKSIEFPESLQTLGNDAFCGTRIDTLRLPDNVTNVSGGSLEPAINIEFGSGIGELPWFFSVNKGLFRDIASSIKFEFDDYTYNYNYKRTINKLVLRDSKNVFNFYRFEYEISKISNPSVATSVPVNIFDVNYLYIGRDVENRETDASQYPLNSDLLEKENYKSQIKFMEIGGFCNKASIIFIASYIDTLQLNSNVTLLKIYDYQLNNCKKIKLMGTLPPSLRIYGSSKDVQTETYINLEIEVPKGCLEVYQNAPGWNKFWNIKEGDYEGQSGVADIEVKEPSKYEMARYDINGVPVLRDYRGLIIIKYSDGSTEKRFIK